MATRREGILGAAVACIGRYGLAKTTVEDVAVEAGVSRATVYREFPGGREELIRETVAWEMGRFFLTLAQAVEGARGAAAVLEEALFFAHRAVGEHAVLQKLLQTEPDRLLPMLTVQASRLLPLIAQFVQPHLVADGLRPGVDADEAAEYVARMVLSFVNAPGRWDLADRGQVAELVRGELLAGVLAV